MALTTQPLKGACTFNPVPSLWSRGGKFKYCVPEFRVVGRKDRSISLKCRSYSSVGTSLVLGPKSKSLQISAFKGGSQYDYSDGSSGNSSEFPKNSFKVSYVQHKSEESTVEPPEVHKVHEEPSFSETSELLNNLEKQIGDITKAVWCYFLGVDATIKVPILLLTPLFLAINIVYGSRVSKELTPLWILGPFIVALYVKTFQSICKLYAFCFYQTAKVVKSLPVYFLVVRDYILHGKLKEALKTFTSQPLADLKNGNYNDMTRRKMSDLLHDMYLDFLVLVWPYYYKPHRFLKSLKFF